MSMGVNNKIIIWGVDDYNVLGLFRQLGNRGLDIEFLIFQGVKNCATASKYCKKYHEELSLEGGLKYLLATYSKEKIKPIIINSNDLIAEYIDIHQTELLPYFIIPRTGVPGNLKKYDNKGVMTDLAAKLGFLIPQSFCCKWDTPIPDIKYPCLLKPTHQTEGKYNEFKFKICHTPKQLSNTLKFVRKESSFILQQYIPKQSVALVYGCRMLDGDIVLAGVLEKDRFCDNGDGSHGVLSAEYPEYINTDLIESIIKKVDFYGLFSVEYGIYENKAYFFEVNWRNDGTSHLFYQAGANIPLAWIYDAAGVSYKDIRTKINPQSVFIDELFDVQNVGKNGLTKNIYEQQLKEASVFKYYDADDVNPYNVVKKRKWKKLLLDSIVAKNRLYIVYLIDKLGIKRK